MFPLTVRNSGVQLYYSCPPFTPCGTMFFSFSKWHIFPQKGVNYRAVLLYKCLFCLFALICLIQGHILGTSNEQGWPCCNWISGFASCDESWRSRYIMIMLLSWWHLLQTPRKLKFSYELRTSLHLC